MPALKPTQIRARVAWLGRVPNRDRQLRSEPLDTVDLDWGGIVGEAHGGVTRPSCSRVVAQHPKGTEIRNVRQVAIVSAEDLAAIAAEMGLPAVDPAWTGAGLVVEGIEDFSHVPPSSRLQGPDGVTLVVDMENRPCHLPAAEIDADPAGQGRGRAFKTAAQGRRGVTAWVERPGRLSLGDTLSLHVPDQPAWRGAAGADDDALSAAADCADMAALRTLIDRLDGRLVALLARRQTCIDRAAELKPAAGLPPRVTERVEAVLANVRARSGAEGLDPALAEALWREMIEWSIAREARAMGQDGPSASAAPAGQGGR